MTLHILKHPLPPERHQPHRLTSSAQTIISEGTKKTEKRSTPNKSYHIAFPYYTVHRGKRGRLGTQA